jgi:hypothetical protein
MTIPYFIVTVAARWLRGQFIASSIGRTFLYGLTDAINYK